MALQFVITNAGRAALLDPANGGSRAVRIASVGVSAAAVAPDPAATQLTGEVKRITTIAGDAVAADTVHLIVRDESDDVYTVRSFALYLADGTLFGIYGQPGVILEKSAGAVFLLAVDLTLSNVPAAAITFGSTNFLNPPATTDRAGVVELATIGEAQAGADAVRAVTPAAAKAAIFDWLGFRPIQQGTGIGQRPNTVKVGWTGSNLAVTIDQTDQGTLAFTSQLADVWRASNDGAGSGLDADLLDGLDSAYFLDIAARLGFMPVQQGTGFGQRTNAIKMGWNGSDVVITVDATNQGAIVFASQLANVWRASNDGAGSGLDADLLDGLDSAYFLDIPARLGFTPIQQATGFGQRTNAIKMGWNGSDITITVDATNQGAIVFASQIADIWRASNDGAGSGLDADLLDGQQGSWYADIAARLGFAPLPASTYTAANVLAKLLGVDGAGSGLDADLLDGLDSAYFLDIAARLGFTPVQQGTGFGQRTNAIKIGWNGSDVTVTVDATNQGAIVFASQIADMWRASNDGAGSGLDADLLDGQQGSWYADIAARLGFAPLPASTYTAANILAKLIGVDGAGSGLDADLLDGRHADAFALLSGAVFTGGILQRGSSYIRVEGAGATAPSDGIGVGAEIYAAAGEANVAAWDATKKLDAPLNLLGSEIRLRANATVSGTLGIAGNTAWHAGNDGSGSGLDADLLDGRDASEFNRVTSFSSAANGYRVHADGYKECWGAVYIAARSSAVVQLPTPHSSWCVPVGNGSIDQDEASIGIVSVNGNPPDSFTVRNKNPLPTTFYWHTRGV